MEARAHRAYRCAHDPRHLLHREVTVEPKDHGDPVVGTECREGAPDGVAIVDRAMGVMRGRRRSCAIQVVVASELPSPKAIAAGVDHDAGEPRVEPIGVAETRMLLPGSNERVVGRIFRLLCVVEDEPSQPVGVVEACLDQPLEGRGARGLGVRRQRPAGVAQLSPSAVRDPSPVPTHQVAETFTLVGPERKRAARPRLWASPGELHRAHRRPGPAPLIGA